MPIFNGTLLTERGLEAANKAANGQFSFTIVKAVASQRDYRDKNDNELRQLTSLDNEVEGKILDQNNADSKVTGIKTSYNNEIATSGYTANTVGLYARDNNGNIFLYSVTTSQIGQVIPGLENDKIFSGFELTIYVIVGNVQNMKVELTPGGDATIDYVNKAIAQYDTVGELGNNDDILKLTKNGHYVINGTNPKNNPWGKNIWADVYKTNYNTLIRDNTGNVFIRSNYDEKWKGLLTNLDRDALSTQSQSLAASNATKITSVADSLGNWNRSGFDQVGGSVAWLYDQNKQRASDVANNANRITSVADSLGNWNRSGFDQVGGSVAWLYGQNEQRASDIANNASRITSVADSLGNWSRSGFDSIGGSVAWLYGQNEQRIADVANLSNSIKYSYIKELGNNDDILNLSQNGHYIIRGANPSNNPWGKNIWADVYKTDYQTIVRDNTGNQFVRSNFDSTWKSLLNNLDRDSLSNQSQSLADSVANSLGTWNRSGFDQVGGSVAWLYGQNEQRASDIANNANRITSVADSLGNWNRSGFDSIGGSVAWLYGQNEQRIDDVASVASSAASANQSLASSKVQDNHDGTVTINGVNYVVTKQLGPNDDVFDIREPGVYTCLWGYQNTLKNFPSPDGAAVILAQGNNVAMKLTVIDSWGGEYRTTWNNTQYNPWEAVVKQSDINAINTRINANEQSINDNHDDIRNIVLMNWEYNSWGLANQNPANRPDCYYRLSDNTIQITGSIDVQNGDYVYFLNRFITQSNINGGFTFNGRNAVISNWSMNSLPFNNPQVYQSVRRNCMAVGVKATQTGKFDLTGCYIQLGFI